MLDSLTPGQTITCTVSKQPRTSATAKTILRLMRRNTEIAKGMRRGQAHRRRTMNTYVRGGRDWSARVRCGQGTRVAAGQTWTMTYTPDLANDFGSVSDFVSVK